MKLVALLIVATLSSAPALAAKAAKKKSSPLPSATEERNISIPVPATELYLSTKPVVDTGPAIATFEFAVSSWSPKEFTRPTYALGATKFSSAGLPYLSINRLAPLYLTGDGIDGKGFHSRLGLSYAKLERSGKFTPGSALITSQTLNLISVRLGAEFLGPRFFGQVAQPYVGFSFLPTLALSSQSQLEGSVSKIGLPMEAGAGVMAYPKILRDFLGMRNGALGLGAHYIFGTLDNSDLSDLCGQLFLRLDI